MEGVVRKQRVARRLRSRHSPPSSTALPSNDIANKLVTKPVSDEDDFADGVGAARDVSDASPLRAAPPPVRAGGPAGRRKPHVERGEDVTTRLRGRALTAWAMEQKERDDFGNHVIPGAEREDESFTPHYTERDFHRSIVHEALELGSSQDSNDFLDEDTTEEEDNLFANENTKWRRFKRWLWRHRFSWLRKCGPVLFLGFVLLIAWAVVREAIPDSTWQGERIQDWILLAAIGLFLVSVGRWYSSDCRYLGCWSLSPLAPLFLSIMVLQHR